jgi:plasmid maintenance system killer protein
MRQNNRAAEASGIVVDSWKNLDLISITRDLSSFLSRFAFLKLQATTVSYLIEQMKLSTESLLKELGDDHEQKSQDRLNDQYDIISKLEATQSWYLSLTARCTYLSERTSTQTQTVVYPHFNVDKTDGLGALPCLISRQSDKQ